MDRGIALERCIRVEFYSWITGISCLIDENSVCALTARWSAFPLVFWLGMYPAAFHERIVAFQFLMALPPFFHPLPSHLCQHASPSLDGSPIDAANSFDSSSVHLLWVFVSLLFSFLLFSGNVFVTVEALQFFARLFATLRPVNARSLAVCEQ